MTLSPNNNLYLIGGYGGIGAVNTIQSSFYAETPDAYSAGGSPTLRVASMTAVIPAVFNAGTQLTVTGSNFKGVTEASGGGAASANSDHHHPRLILQSVEGSGGSSSQGNSGFIVDLTTQIYTNLVTYPNGLWSTIDSSITVQLAQSTIPVGWYQIRVGANAQLSLGSLVQAGPPKPPNGVTSVAATAINVTSITYSWTQPLNPGTDYNGYNVYLATTGVWVATAPYNRTQTTNASYTFTGLTPSSTNQIVILPYSITGDASPTPLAFSATYHTLPNLPTNLSTGAISFNSVQLAWSTNSNGQGTIYEVSDSQAADFSTNVSTPYPVAAAITTNTVTVAPLSQSTTYYFRVRAMNLDSSFSVFTATVSAWTRKSVTNVSGIADSPTSIHWTWPSSGNGVQYKVYCATSATIITSTSAIFFEDTGLGVDSNRSIQVSAVASGLEGPLSNPTTVYTQANAPSSSPQNPPIPSTGSIMVFWQGTNSQGASNPSGTTYHLILTSGTNIAISTAVSSAMSSQGLGAQQFTFSNLTPAQLYTIGVQALNGDGLAPTPGPVWPVLITTWTQAQAPANLQVTGTSPSSISVVWSTNNNTSSATYQVTYTTTPVNLFDQYASTAVFFSQGFSSNTAIITGLLTSMTYSIRVQARNPAGATTGYSNFATTMTYNGGGAIGSLSFLAAALQNSSVSGSIGSAPNVRAVIMRSLAGAFSSDTTVTISTFAATTDSPCNNGIASMAFSVAPNPALQPTHPLFLTLAYDPTNDAITDPAHLVLMRYDPAAAGCVPVPTTIDTVGHTLTAQLNHLSIFQAGTILPSSTPDTARIYPNPFHTATDGYVTIDQIPASARVRIFTILGELVLDQEADASGIVTWKGLNRGGRPVASGVYFVVIEGNGKKILKLAIIR